MPFVGIRQKEDIKIKHLGLLVPAEEPKFDEKYNVIEKGLYWNDEEIKSLDNILKKEKKKKILKLNNKKILNK